MHPWKPTVKIDRLIVTEVDRSQKSVDRYAAFGRSQRKAADRPGFGEANFPYRIHSVRAVHGVQDGSGCWMWRVSFYPFTLALLKNISW